MRFLQKSIFVTPLTEYGSFWRGVARLGGPLGHPLGLEILVLTLVSCVFAAQRWVCVGFFQNVLICRILTLTWVRNMVVFLPRVVFGWLARVVLLRILLLT